jgi:uncharacterized membrane protein YhdT
MSDYLLLPALGLCIASILTVVGARLVQRAGRHLPLPLWFIVVSLATPLVWIAFQAVILAIILPDPDVHAGLVRKWPLYLREVVFGIAWKLWICGAVCTAGLALFKRRSSDGPVRDARAQYWLLHLGGAIAAAIILPATMDYWIDHGRVNGRFAFVALGYAFFVGLIPVIATSFALLRMGGARAQLRYAEPVAALYAAIIVWRGYVWHQAVASRPGAFAVIAVEICAILGVFAAWFAVRRGNRAAAAVAERLSR